MTDKENNIEKALAASRVYRVISSGFLYPDAAVLSGLRGSCREAKEALAFLGCSDGLLEALESLRAGLERTSVPDLQAEHIGIFGHTISKDFPPYETQYGEPHVFQQTQVLADIAGFYRAFGLETSELARERFDHISIETEFMAILACKEAYARARDEDERVEICVDAQKNFLGNHLGGWVPSFMERLSKKATAGFYRDLVRLTEGFLAFDVGVKGAQPTERRQLMPIGCESAENCFACGGQDVGSPEEAMSA